MRVRPVILATCGLVLAGCGSQGTVAAKPETVVGSVPKQTSTQATTTAPSTSSGGGGRASGKALFTSSGCVSCHTYKPAGSSAKIGPDLDKLTQYAKQAKQPLPQFVRTSITDPNAYIQPGFPRGVMPSFATLPKSQVDALVTFLTKGS
jgi:cytochrome c551/c552